MGDKQSKPQVVIAIDFGTSYTGYAYSYVKNREKTNLNENWGAELGAQFYKTPTAVLYSKGKEKFQSFGFEAENDYYHEIETCTEKQIKPGLYRFFKMQLHEKKDVGSQFALNSQDGASKPAIEVFADAIRFIKEHAVAKIETHEPGVTKNAHSIQWIVTVPAIWEDQHKIFMREACLKANLMSELKSQDLIIALEPECASLHCRKLPANEFPGITSKNFKLSTGTKYMVIDMGGGTVDIAVHKVTPDGIEEVIPSFGGNWGGNNVNKQFENILTESLGKKFITYTNSERPSILHRIMMDFEKVKRSYQEGKPVYLPVSYALTTTYQEFTNNEKATIEDILASGGSLSMSKNGHLVIESETMGNFFKTVVDKIIDEVAGIWTDELADHVVAYIFLVGGFAECSYVQKKMKMLKDILPGVLKPKVLIPNEASLCVLRGAVLFGHDPNAIKARISRYTYAVLRYRDFDLAKYDASKKVKLGSKIKEQYLEKIISKGTRVEEGFLKEMFIPVEENQREVNIALYTSTARFVEVPDDPKVSQIGSLTVQCPKLEKATRNRRIKVVFIFGKTELQVRAIDTATNEQVTSSFSFSSKDSDMCSVM